jgi:hypothetical protein
MRPWLMESATSREGNFSLITEPTFRTAAGSLGEAISVDAAASTLIEELENLAYRVPAPHVKPVRDWLRAS